MKQKLPFHLNFCKAIPYRMIVYMYFNLATWLRIVNFAELNISELLFLNLSYISYHCKVC